ncbi:MAG: nucleotidyl transferase AbiEii/AbiGii toxin family protein [Deltaproteobacteria bacterium]|nr:nucleotidyl transferase AbiEii/AbiGii toxin family protein [Deltaproteobacteria bacterium]
MPTFDELPADFRDFLVALVEAHADFVLIGGWALAVHGRPRATEDLDILVRPTPVNAQRVYRALVAFGAPVAAHGVSEQLFAADRYGYRFGVKPNLIEVLTTISGVDFDTCLVDVVTVEIDEHKVPVIGREALLRNKKAAARDKDLDDVRWLERHPPPVR